MGSGIRCSRSQLRPHNGPALARPEEAAHLGRSFGPPAKPASLRGKALCGHLKRISAICKKCCRADTGFEQAETSHGAVIQVPNFYIGWPVQGTDRPVLLRRDDLHTATDNGLNLRAPGASESPRCLSGSFEGGCSIFRRHSYGRLDFRQTASSSSSQYRRGRSFLVRELADDQPIMAAEGQVPPDEPASYALEEFANGFLTIFWLSQHALDGVRSETTARDIDQSGACYYGASARPIVTLRSRRS